MNDEINERFAALEARLASVEAKLWPERVPRTPYQPAGDHYLDRMLVNSTGELMREMAKAVPDSAVRDIVGDSTGRRR
jgi:hypothetical protein